MDNVGSIQAYQRNALLLSSMDAMMVVVIVDSGDCRTGGR